MDGVNHMHLTKLTASLALAYGMVRPVRASMSIGAFYGAGGPLATLTRAGVRALRAQY